jgi:signal peptidase II
MVSRKYLVLASLCGTVISLDQGTKFWVGTKLKLNESQPVIENLFHLSLVQNTGAAFGLFSGLDAEIREPLFLIVPSITLLMILFVYSRLKDFQNFSIFSFGLIIGGALGNLLDRTRLGHVVDFLDFHWNGRAHFPTFNVADAAISLGVAILFVGIFWETPPKGEIS